MPAAGYLSLAADFPPATREVWLKVVTSALRGAPSDQLTAHTRDGVPIDPLYDRSKLSAVIASRGGRPWQIMQRVDHPDPAFADAEACHDVADGANGLSIVFPGAIGARGFGIAATEDDLMKLISGLGLEAGIVLELDLGPYDKEAPQRLAAAISRSGVHAAATQIRFGIDPLGAGAMTGHFPQHWPQLALQLAKQVAQLVAQGFRGPFVAADARPVHDAGGSEAQELAFALSNAVAYLRALEVIQGGLDHACDRIFFRLSADADQFLTIAKFRALRRLWGRIQEACGLKPRFSFVSAETSWRMMSRRDPWVNILRTTLAAFSAGVGGADAVTMLPFTAAIGLPDGFARRVARNAQLILLEESNLAKVVDPAAGSGYVEHLTEALCQTTWTLFQELEAAGGSAAALANGLIQEKIAKVRAEREAAVARRTEPLTGTSEFPDLAEAPVAVLAAAPHDAGQRPAATDFEPLRARRLAEPFEALREASDRMLATAGSRPKVFLANLGPIAAFTAPATYARNFFEAGGIEALTNDGFMDHPAMISAFRTSGAKLACLCTSEALFASEAAGAARALTAAGCRGIYMVHTPGQTRQFGDAEIGTFVYSGCDAIATLGAAQQLAGV